MFTKTHTHANWPITHLLPTVPYFVTRISSRSMARISSQRRKMKCSIEESFDSGRSQNLFRRVTVVPRLLIMMMLSSLHAVSALSGDHHRRVDDWSLPLSPVSRRKHQQHTNNNIQSEPQQRRHQDPPPVLVFILVGQSNMQGHGYVNATTTTTVTMPPEQQKDFDDAIMYQKYKNGTLEWMVETYPEKYGKLKRKKKKPSWKQPNNKNQLNDYDASKQENDTSTTVVINVTTAATAAATSNFLRHHHRRSRRMQTTQTRPNINSIPQPKTNTEDGHYYGGEDGWTTRDDVWVAYNYQWIHDVRPAMNLHGILRPGYGGDPDNNFEIGPEYGFGWTVAEGLNEQQQQQQHHHHQLEQQHQTDRTARQKKENEERMKQKHQISKQQILLIKVGWGGKSLAVDFRPPSSSNETTTTGLFYTAMMSDIYLTLAKLDDLFPPTTSSSSSSSLKKNEEPKGESVVNDDDDDDDRHHPGQGQDEHDDDGNSKINYKLSGLFWHQGWNDGCFEDMTNEYESNLVNLIRDVRTDLQTPKLPVVIANSGMVGYDGTDKDDDESKRRKRIIDAQMAVGNDDTNKYPDFVGTVQSVETRPFFRPVENSPGNQIYHWNNNCESYWLVGEASAHAMLEIIRIAEKEESTINSTI